MTRDALEKLVDAAQRLPLPPEPLDASATTLRTADRRTVAPRLAERLRPAALRERVRELLLELATRVDEALPRTLAHADIAWDQVDAMRILDRGVRDEARALRGAAHALAAIDDAATRALALEAQLTLDAALDLISLFERRLATLVRLRARVEEASLLPEGRPFLDLGAALHETARRWA